MSIFIKSVNVPATTPDSIATYNGVAIGDNSARLVLNGRLVGADSSVTFVDKGYSSAITFSFNNDLSTVLFTVNGYSNGKLVSEELRPNGDFPGSATTITMFDVVTSIYAKADLAREATFTIGSNRGVVILFDSYEDTKKAGRGVSRFELLTSNVFASTDWNAGSYIQYGIAGNNLTGPLKTTDFVYANRLSNYIAINNVTEAISSADLNRGIMRNEQYPFLTIAIVLLNGVNRTPSYIEITQNV